MRWKLKQLNIKLCCKLQSPAHTHMVLNSIYEKCWDLYCVKAPSKSKKCEGKAFRSCVENDSRLAKHTQMSPRYFVLLPYPLISLETSPRQITSCSAVSVPKQHHCLVPLTHSTTHTNTLSPSVPLALAFTQNAISCALIWSALGTESPRHSFPMIPVWRGGRRGCWAHNY